MAKKRNKKKEKNRKKKQIVGLSDVDSQINEIKKLLALGSVRKASAIGYMLLTRPALTDEHIELIIETQTLRLREMILNHQISKASSKLNNILKYHPEWQTLFSQELLLKLDLEGESDLIIRNYGIDDQSTKIVDDYIQNELRDIRPLSLHPKLSGNHLLKKQSGILLAAWEEIESKTGATENFEIMLKTIGRKSPFVGWRLFVQALNFWYNDEDDSALKFLNKSGSFNCIKPAAEILRNLIENKNCTTKAGQFIEKKVCYDEKYHKLWKLSRLLKNKLDSTTARKVVDLFENPVYPDMPLLHLEISAIIFESFKQIDELEESIAYVFADIFTEDFLAPIYIKNDILQDCCSEDEWEKYLEINDENLTDIDRSLIYFRMGEENYSGLSEANRLSMLRMFNSFRKNYGGNDDGYSELEKLEKLEDEDFPTPAELIADGIKCLRLSLRFHKTVEAYKLWYKFELESQEKSSAFRIARVLLHWKGSFPNDIEPLLNLAELEEHDDCFSKALKYLNKASKIDSNNSEVIFLRCNIILKYVVKLLAKDKNKKAIKILKTIPDKSPVFFQVIAAILQWIAERKHPENQKIVLEKLGNLNQPVTVECACKKLKQLNSKFDISEILSFNSKFAKKYEMIIDNLLLFSDERLKKTDWNLLFTVTDIGMIKTAFENADISADKIKSCLELIIEVDRNNKKLVWLLTGKGLNAGGAHIETFLAFRGLVVDNESSDDRIIECLSAAEFIALKEGNEDALRQLESIYDYTGLDMDDLIENISQDRVEKIIAFEKQYSKPTDIRYRRNAKSNKKKEKNTNQMELF